MSYNDKHQDQSRLASKQSESLRPKYDGFTLVDEGKNRFGKPGLPHCSGFPLVGLLSWTVVADLDLAKPFKSSLLMGLIM